MAASIDSLIESFPYPTIPPIQGRPTHQSLQALTKLIYENAASVPSGIGGGNHGHLGVPMPQPTYNIVAGNPWVPPLNPGPVPVIPPGATQAMIAALERQHKEELRIWQLHRNVDAALKQQVQNAVPRMYIKALANQYTGFMGVTCAQLLTHLKTTYGRLTPTQLTENDKHFRQAYDPSRPIEDMYERIEMTVETANDAGTPYTVAQVLQNAYAKMFQSGLYGDACKEWRRKPEAEKTWPNFQTHFAEAVLEREESEQTTAQQGYAGNVDEIPPTEDELTRTADALMNLATASQEDRRMLADLTAMNQRLLQTIEDKDKKIEALQKQVDQLKKKPRGPRGGGSRRYCWSHGYNPWGHDHTSQTCRNKKEGHQDNATWENNMNGSQHKKP